MTDKNYLFLNFIELKNTIKAKYFTIEITIEQEMKNKCTFVTSQIQNNSNNNSNSNSNSNSNTIPINLQFEFTSINKINEISFCVTDAETNKIILSGNNVQINTTKNVITDSFTCLLFSSNQSSVDHGCIDYNFKINNLSLVETYENNIKQNEVNDIWNQQTHSNNSSSNGSNRNNDKSVFDHLKQLASRKNTNNFKMFIKNQSYFIALKNTIIEIFTWKDYWKTLSILFGISILILHFQYCFILVPVIIIFLHINYRNNLVNSITFKTAKEDKLKNMEMITETMEIINGIIHYYESMVEAFENAQDKIIEEIYENLLKLIPYLFVTVYFELYNIKVFLLILVWIIFLFNNYHCKAFTSFLFSFVVAYKPKMLFVSNSKNKAMLEYLFKFVPFTKILYKINNIINLKRAIHDDSKLEIKDVLNQFDYNNNSLKLKEIVTVAGNATQELLTFELYENERWWVMIGWAKKLMLNERSLYSDKTGTKQLNFDFVFFDTNHYEWISDWKIHKDESTDKDGWSYGKDFNSTDFTSVSHSKYVRTRKWIRFANQKNVI